MKGKRILKPLCEVKDRALSGLKNYLEQRTHRQRLYIVLTAFLLFAVADIWMMARYFTGHTQAPQVEHIEPLKP